MIYNLPAKKNSRYERGFTLIEVLIVIVIIAILSVIAIPNYRKFQNRQIVLNAGQALAAQLKLAQSNAKNSVSCLDSSYTYPRSWDVVLYSPSSSDPNSYVNAYQFRAQCYNPNGSYSLTTGDGIKQIWSTTIVSLPTGLSLNFNYLKSSDSNGRNPDGTLVDPWLINSIDFSTNGTVSYDFGSPSPIQITDGTTISTINIDSSGNITVN